MTRFSFSLSTFLAVTSSIVIAHAVPVSANSLQDDPCEITRSSSGKPCVTITPYRTKQPIGNVGSSVTVLTQDELSRRGDISVADALKRVPGFNLSRSGGFGSTSSLRLRGSEPGQVRVLIDGVSVNDPSNITGEFDFSTLLISNISRIEVLRGPQSSLYGSDAIGGVINIITSAKDAPKGATAFIEHGTYNTTHTGAGYNGGNHEFYYGLHAQHFDTDGFSRVTAGDEADGSNINDVRGSLGGKITEHVSLDVSGGYSDADLDFDPGTTIDGPASQTREQIYGSAEVVIALLEGQLDNTFKVGANRTDRHFDEPLGFNRFSDFEGTRTQVSYQADLKLRTRDVATVGIEWQNDEAKNTNTSSAGVTTVSIDNEISNTALFAQYILGLTNNWTLTAGGRFDDNEIFGEEVTYRFTTAYDIEQTNTTLRGSIGTGFKAPTLFQLYSTFGNTMLQPEESLGYDVGIEQRFIADRLVFNVTFFRNDFENLIQFDLGTFNYLNVAEATTQGVETAVTFAATPMLLLHGSHTYLDAEDEVNNMRLPRRPKHMATLGFDYDVLPEASIGAQWRYVGTQLDNSFNGLENKSYSTVDLTGSYDVNPYATFYTRIENMFDQQHSEVANFTGGGMAAYVGVRGKY